MVDDGLSPQRQHLRFLANFITEYLYIPDDNTPLQSAAMVPSSNSQTNESQQPESAAPSYPDKQSEQGLPEEQEQAPVAAEELATPYKKAGTETGEDDSAGSEDAGELSHYGGFQQGIVLLVNYSSKTNLIRKDELVLKQILRAVKLSLDDVAVINIGCYPKLSYQSIIQQYPAGSVIGFDIPSEFIPQSPEPYQPSTTEDGVQVLVADAVADIAAHKSLKKQLWTGLKTLFNPA